MNGVESSQTQDLSQQNWRYQLRLTRLGPMSYHRPKQAYAAVHSPDEEKTTVTASCACVREQGPFFRPKSVLLWPLGAERKGARPNHLRCCLGTPSGQMKTIQAEVQDHFAGTPSIISGLNNDCVSAHKLFRVITNPNKF